ncbi:MAG: small basic family protein [Armatimonadetes bacterium]|nr:small basic family protein [Armatimonadota bacterium]MDW8123066.1 small basic family protein [Armatimonadota bacterium]
MWLVLLSLFLGLVLGFLATPPEGILVALHIYLGPALLAALDAIVGGWRASLEGTYDTAVFVSGFFVNMLAAGLLAYVGDLLRIDLALAAVVAFGPRIFNNLALVRRIYLQRWRQRVAPPG